MPIRLNDMFDTEYFNSDSGLRVLYVSGSGNSTQRVSSLKMLSCSGRYELVELPPSSLNDNCLDLIRSLMNSNLFKVPSKGLKQININFLGDGFLFRFQRVIILHWVMNFLYVFLHLFVRLKLSGGVSSFIRRLQLSVIGATEKQFKNAASTLVESRVAIVLMSPDTSIAQRFVMLTTALYARIPIVFLSGPLISGNEVSCLSETVEIAAHNAIRRRRRSNSKLESISDIYGAKTVVASYCGIAAANAHIPGFWMHGWIPEYHNVNPAFIALHKTETTGIHLPWARDIFDKTDVQLVIRVDQERFLREQGYANVKAIGHPLVYMEQPALQRIKGSLLVVPPHGEGLRGEGDALVRQYVEYICSLKDKFSLIKLCVTVDGYIKRDWWPAFEKAGIGYVVSVERSDPDALYRLRHILSRFEYVTTNSYGSIIAYAAFSGCNISVAGPYAELPRQLIEKAHAVIHFPQLLEAQIVICSEKAFKSHYAELFIEPENSIERTDWGCRELGLQNRLSPGQMRTLLMDECGSNLVL